MKSPLAVLVTFFALCLSLSNPAEAAGNGNNGKHYGRNSTVKVSISPSSSTLQVGQSLQFSASVSGTSNAGLNWLVNGTVGGNSATGTISTSGTYTAPATVPSGPVTVTAQSVAVDSAVANASILVVSVPLVGISVSPASASVQVGQSQQFSASVSGTTNRAVNWMVDGVLGGNSSLGTISTAGLYIAPQSVPASAITVTAQSQAQSSSSASATVSITAAPVSVSISPGSASVQVGHCQQFSASISGTSNTAVSWVVNGSPGGNSTAGTITSTGMYTAPSSVPAGQVTVTAQSGAQNSASANATVSVTPAAVSVSISPTNVSMQVGQSQPFSATVSGASNSSVNWLVSGVLGGDSSVGTITSAGLYTAPGTAPSGLVTVTAQSVAIPSSSASASVSVTQPVSHSVNLSWNASTSSVAGYNVYRGTQQAGPYSKINPVLEIATVYTDNSVVSGQTYYYTTTAVDSSGTQSGYSNVAQVSVP